MPTGSLALSPMRSLSRANEALARMSTRVKSIQSKAQEMTDSVIQSAEVAGAGFAAGMISGRYGTVEVVGVPLELALGVGLNLAGHAKLAGSSSEHLHNFGDGFLAAYFVTLGRGVGRTMGQQATPPPAPAP